MPASIPARRFLFLRHGQTDWNVEGRFQDQSDIALQLATARPESKHGTPYLFEPAREGWRIAEIAGILP